jgi:type II secretory pathway pseudopilin PulG
MEAVTDWTPRMKRAYMREQRAAHRFDGYEDVAERAQKQTDEQQQQQQQQQQQRTGYEDALLSLASLGKAVVEAVGDWTPRMTRAFLREQRNEKLVEGVYRNDKQAEQQQAEQQQQQQQQQQRTGYEAPLRIGTLGMGTIDGWGHVLPSPSPSHTHTPSSEVYGTKSWSYDSWWKEPISEADFSYSESTEQPDSDTDSDTDTDRATTNRAFATSWYDYGNERR